MSKFLYRGRLRIMITRGPLGYTENICGDYAPWECEAMTLLNFDIVKNGLGARHCRILVVWGYVHKGPEESNKNATVSGEDWARHLRPAAFLSWCADHKTFAAT